MGWGGGGVRGSGYSGTHMAEHVRKSCFRSDPDKKSTTATKPSSGRRFSGLLPNVQNLFLSTTSLGTNLVSHRNLLHTKSYLTHGVLCSRHLVHTRVMRGSSNPPARPRRPPLRPPWGGADAHCRLNISISEKSPILRQSMHPALFHSAESVHSSSSGPQFSSHATEPQMPQLRMRPMPLSSSMHLSQTRSWGVWRERDGGDFTDE